MGKAFLCIDDKNIKNILNKTKNKNFYTYGLSKKSNFQILNVKQKINFSSFDIKINIPANKKTIKNIKIPLIGMHNVKNVTSALAVAFSIGISEKIIKKGLIDLKALKKI